MLPALATSGVLSIVISISIARSVGVTEFGVYSIVLALQNVVVLFPGFSLGTAIGKYVSEYKVRDAPQAAKYARIGLELAAIVSLSAAAVYLLLADFIGHGLYHEPSVTELIPFSCLVVLSTALYATTFGIAQGNQLVKLMALMQVSNPATSLALILLLVNLVGTEGVFLGYSIAQTGIAIVAITYINSRRFSFLVPGRMTQSPGIVKTLLAFAVPAVIASAIVGLVYWIGTTDLALESGVEDVAYFAVAFVFFQGLALVPNAIMLPLVPKVSELSAIAHSMIESLMRKLFHAACVLQFPVLFAVAFFSGTIVQILYGSDFSAAGEFVYWMVAASYFYSLAVIIGALLMGLGRMWVGLALNVIWGSVFVALALLLIPEFGPLGLAGGFAISFGVHLVVSMLAARRLLKVDLGNVYVPVAMASIFFLVGGAVLFGPVEQGIIVQAVVLLTGIAVFAWLGRTEIPSAARRLMGVIGGNKL